MTAFRSLPVCFACFDRSLQLNQLKVLDSLEVRAGIAIELFGRELEALSFHPVKSVL